MFLYIVRGNIHLATLSGAHELPMSAINYCMSTVFKHFSICFVHKRPPQNIVDISRALKYGYNVIDQSLSV